MGRIAQNTGKILSDDDVLYIGKLPGFGSFDGLIDDVRVYNYALSPAEVLSLFTSGQSTAVAAPRGLTIQ